MKKRRYDNDDPSVTEIIGIVGKESLIYAYGALGTKEMERRAAMSQAFGNKVHKAMEKFLKGGTFSEASEGLNETQVSILSRLIGWCTDNNFKPKKKDVERPLRSENHKFNGTPDAVDKVIVDWKTDSIPKTAADERERVLKYVLQHAGNSIAYHEETGKWLNKAVTIRVSKNLEFKEYTFNNLKLYRPLFINLRELYRHLKGN